MCVRVLGQPPIHRLVLAWQSASIWPTGLTLREFQWRTGTISIRALLPAERTSPLGATFWQRSHAGAPVMLD